MVADPVISLSDDQVCCDLNGEAVILSLKTGKYYGLDEVGARVWALIKEPTPFSALRERLLLEFEVDPARCESDLEDLIRTLSDAGLVHIQP